jgi:hypothetical protein
MSSGCRYSRAIRQSMNKILDNRSSINRILADLIASYSHTLPLRRGNYLFGPRREYFVINEVLSHHWVTGFFCPPRIEFFPANLVLYHPDLSRRTRIRKKRLYDPFGMPLVRCRNKTFKQEINEHQSYSNLAAIYA